MVEFYAILIAQSSSEEDWAGTGSVNFDVTGRAVCILSILIVLRSGRFQSSDTVRDTVTLKAQLANLAHSQHARVC
jgi:hypothetical protein